ncbi:stealth family protein [Sulfitobacter guttiformis]|uniref:Stealth-like protein n=1 Tax=Sulfitobacter guttiformis TaxID=74349 RepID=A0A420DTX2_9RHOB|nr:stealth family protein [Sulfitobacter guttiformis]RKE97685.1 Stealth-like protein [Sulfitobacter guttiformis]
MTEILATDPIDAVITWVDGTSLRHRAQRASFMAQTGGALNENASNPHRWESSDEIYYCLRSIHVHAPWIRHIWIVVDEGAPDLERLPVSLREKIRIVRHAAIFEDYGHVLPTFNSLSIESMLWRIAELSERFLYFNDDVFLTAPVKPSDFFDGQNPVLRGAWRDYSELVNDGEARDNPALFNHFMQVNAAALCGVPSSHVFAAAHVVHPMRRSVMAHLFGLQRDAFEANIIPRFRDIAQFLPQGLHNHHCIAMGQAVVSQQRDHLHIKSGQGAGQAPDATRALFTREALAKTKFLCINDLPQLEALVPDARDLIAQAVGYARTGYSQAAENSS